jgi:hypothetical protein
MAIGRRGLLRTQRLPKQAATEPTQSSRKQAICGLSPYPAARYVERYRATELAKHRDPRARAIVRCMPSTHRYDARVAFTSPESRGGAGNKCADQHRYSDED